MFNIYIYSKYTHIFEKKGKRKLRGKVVSNLEFCKKI